MMQHQTVDFIIFDEDDNEIPCILTAFVEPAEPGLHTMAEGWIEPPKPEYLSEFEIHDERGARRYDLEEHVHDHFSFYESRIWNAISEPQ